MEIDAYFQGFEDGAEATGGGRLVREVLDPHVVREEPEHRYLEVRDEAGGADVYLDEDQMLVNHVVGDTAWDLLVEGARAANWVILPPGRPVCITDERQRPHLPEGFEEDVVLVRTGADLRDVIQSR